MLLLRFGKDGVIGRLPDVFNPADNWPAKNALFTGPGGAGLLSYNEHHRLFHEMKNAAGMHHLLNEQATKLRSFGAMQASENQAGKDWIEGAGRWNSQANSKQSAGHVMDRHYLKNLSYEVLLANAGFNAKQWNLYRIPRSRGTTVHDSHVKTLIEFFFPNLYHACDRARSAFEGNAIEPSDAVSTTNVHFLETVRELTLFWLQDTIILIPHHPELARVAPWSTLLYACWTPGNGHLFNAYQTFGTIVQQQDKADNAKKQNELLSQEQLYAHVREGALQYHYHYHQN